MEPGLESRLPPRVLELWSRDSVPAHSIPLSLSQIVARGEITGGQRVVVISTANGLKFTDFKIGYHEGTLAGIESHNANGPVLLPNDYDAVLHAIDNAAAAAPLTA